MSVVFRQEVQDVKFRDLPLEVVKQPTVVALTSQEEIGEVRISPKEKQPKEIGFAFVIHAPGLILKDFNQDLLSSLAEKGMRIEASKPLFLKTDRVFHKYTFKRGDKESAKKVYAFLKARSHSVFKNWI